RGVRGGRLMLEDATAGRGGLLAVGETGQLKHPAHVGGVLLADRGVVLAAVVRLVRQPEAGLLQVQQVPVRVPRVGVDEQPDRVAHPRRLQAAQYDGQLRRVYRAADGCGLVGDRIRPGRVDGRSVHEAAVDVADLALLGAVRGVAGAGGLDRLLDQRAYVGLRPVAQL